ncbi:Protein C13B4.1 a [Aphelenchoides avenae]|nr:Protein C13B4.1 a [Aphelenchus avenae]
MRTSESRLSNVILLLCLTLVTVAANFDTSECEKSKVCVAHPTNCFRGPLSGCEYAFSYAVVEDSSKRFDMELYTRRPDASFNYIAVGFSDDGLMGNDIVLHCASVNGQPVEVHLSKNPGKSNQPAGADVDKAALSLAASESDENHIYCKFALTYDASVQQSLPDPATQYHLLFARGPTRSPQSMSIHSTGGGPNFPVSTGFKVDLLRHPSGASANATADQDIAAPADPEGGPFSLRYSTRRLFVRFHGLIMVLAWIGFVAIALFSARYMRDLWPSTTPFGLKMWFLIHRTLNFIAVLMMVLAAIFILVGKDLRWTGPWTDRDADSNWKAGPIHSLIGLIAVVLALAQPFIALTRCGVDHPQRPIFNVIHRTIGVVATVLAAVAVFIALLNFTKLLSDPVWAAVVFSLYIILAILLVVGVEVMQRKYSKQQKLTAIEMRSKASPATENYYYHTQRAASAKAQRLTIAFFVAFAAISIASAIVLFIMILP